MNCVQISRLFVLLILAGRGKCAPLSKIEFVTLSSTPDGSISPTIPDKGVKNMNDASKYLSKYGYLNINASSKNFESLDKIKEALILFQKTFKKNVTGKLDNDTLSLMNSRRCSVPDIVANSSNGRQKRYVLAKPWSKNVLTYWIQNYPRITYGFNSQFEVVKAIDDSFEIWRRYANLELVKYQSNLSDIWMSFRRGEHGDLNPFDGPGGVLGHASFPEFGEIHMDNEETWSKYGDENINHTNLRLVLAHEVGHALGLDHSFDESALMFPYYRYGPFKLHNDDIMGIKALYGAKPEAPPTSTSTTSTPSTTTTTESPERKPSTAKISTTTNLAPATARLNSLLLLLPIATRFLFCLH